MTSLAEQLSAVRKSQWEAQLAILQAFSNRAIYSAEQLLSLNLRATRTSFEQATGTFKQLLDATNPRDVIAVGARAQGQWHYLFEYGRELLGIASGAPLQTWTTQPVIRVLPPPLQLARSANVPTTVTQVMEQTSIAAADATTVTTEIAAAAADTGAALTQAGLQASKEVAERAAQAAEQAAEPVAKAAADQAGKATAAAQEPAPAPADVLKAADAAIDTAIADETPHAKEKPVAEALNEVAPKAASVEHPIASTVPLEAQGQVEMPAAAPAPAPAVKERRTSRRSK